MPVYNWRDPHNLPGPATILDADTGEELHRIYLVDTEQGLIGRYVLDHRGRHLCVFEGGTWQPVTLIERKRVKILWRRQGLDSPAPTCDTPQHG